MRTVEEIRSDFLFGRPSFVEGWARLWDFGNCLNEYNVSEEPDAVALWMDWAVVGDQIASSTGRYAKEHDVKAA